MTSSSIGYNYKTFWNSDCNGLIKVLDECKNWLQEQYMYIEVISINILNSDEWYGYKVVVWYKSK